MECNTDKYLYGMPKFLVLVLLAHRLHPHQLALFRVAAALYR